MFLFFAVTPARIIEKYRDYPRSTNVTTLLPVPTNQKMNAYLKEIADITDIFSDGLN